MPWRYAANPRQTTKYTRAVNARLFRKAVARRRWDRGEPITWEVARPLLTREVLNETLEEINAELTESARAVTPCGGGEDYVARVQSRSSIFPDRETAIEAGNMQAPTIGLLEADDEDALEEPEDDDQPVFCCDSKQSAKSPAGQIHLALQWVPACDHPWSEALTFDTGSVALRRCLQRRSLCEACFAPVDESARSEVIVAVS